jgi:hypothetical protein
MQGPGRRSTLYWGNADHAIPILKRLQINPIWDPIRKDPRFQKLCEQKSGPQRQRFSSLNFSNQLQQQLSRKARPIHPTAIFVSIRAGMPYGATSASGKFSPCSRQNKSL